MGYQNATAGTLSRRTPALIGSALLYAKGGTIMEQTIIISVWQENGKRLAEFEIWQNERKTLRSYTLTESSLRRLSELIAWSPYTSRVVSVRPFLGVRVGWVARVERSK